MSVKSTIKPVLQKLKSKAVITTLGCICLALLFWFGGPLISISGFEPLTSSTSRLVVLLVIAVVWGAINLTHRVKDKKDNEEQVNNLIHGDGKFEKDAGDEAVKAEINTLQAKMVQALDILKNTKFTNNTTLSDLPWYIMIGPPGSGKTTAIQNSGLEYPLKETMGIDMIQGVGGTRHCDWWFTNKAVLIDTAGRYTTQDSHANKDSRAWQGFLGLLRKFRPIRPINGVIISMSMAELLDQTKTERNLHARAIKQRLQELQNQLGMTFPVYVMLSKSDLVAGFDQFFDDLTQEECEQVWGITFPYDSSDQSGVVNTFNKQFHQLLTNLNARINTRLKHERDLTRRATIYEFPKQLRLLQRAADDFLKEIFSPNAYEDVPMLRGVYFISATQEGTPIDHLSEHLSVGLTNETKTASVQTNVRSYFIKNLLTDVVFPEQNLATTNKKQDKKASLFQKVAVGISSVVVVAMSLFWWNSYDWNKNLIDDTNIAIKHYNSVTLGGLTAQTQVIILTQGLSSLRSFPTGFKTDPLEDAHRLGLYQGDKIKQPASLAYQRALQGYLLPYMLDALRLEMVDNAKHLNYLYETLKVYLMLQLPEYYEEEDIKIWFSAYIDRTIIGEANASIRHQLNSHLDTLLKLGVRGDNINQESVSSARQALTMLPLVERAYQRLRSDFLESSIPDFKVVDILSFSSLPGFKFTSGKELSEGIPGLYTYNGFHGIFTIEKKKIIQKLMKDSWVYGDEIDSLDSYTKENIAKELEQKYLRDYIFYWEEFLNDISVKEYNSLDSGVKVTRALSGPDAPINSIITAVTKNVQLTKLPVSNNTKAAASIANSVTDVAFASKKSRISRLLPKDSIKLDIKLPGIEVEQAFSSFLTLDTSELERVQRTLRSLNRNLEKALVARAVSNSPIDKKLETEFSQLGSQLSEQIDQMPFPLKRWIGPIANRAKSIAQTNQNQRINDIWKTQVVDEYRRAIAGRYPFKQTSKETRVKDFSKFFGYNGTLDKFWNKFLKQHVDDSSMPWRFTKNLGISNDVLVMYQHARKIKESFFESGSKKPKVGFSIEPESLDDTISLFLLEVNGQQLKYRHGPPRKNKFSWPSKSANQETRIIFTPPNGGRTINKKYSGEWSLFRFLDEQQRKRTRTKKDRLLSISLNGYKAKLRFFPNSVNNPFWLSSLKEFSCPENL